MRIIENVLYCLWLAAALIIAVGAVRYLIESLKHDEDTLRVTLEKLVPSWEGKYSVTSLKLLDSVSPRIMLTGSSEGSGRLISRSASDS